MFDETWEEIHKSKEWGRYPAEEIVRFIARNYYSAEARSDVKLLDYGCGTGANAWFFAREGFNTFGIDGSETAIFKANKRFEQEGLNAEFVICDAINTPWEKDFFNAVVDGAMIYANTTDGIKKLLQEAFRILKHGGKICSTGLFKTTMFGFGTGVEIEKNTYKDITEGNLAGRGTVHFFEEEEVKELFLEAGFKNIKIDYLNRSDKGGTSSVEFFIVEAEK